MILSAKALLDEKTNPTEEEVRDYEEYYSDIAIHSLASGVKINDSDGRYTQLSISFGGATGDVDSEDPITMDLSYSVKWSSLAIDDYSYHVYKTNYFDLEFDFKFIAPQGYMINNLEGLNNPKYNSDSTIVTGRTGEEAHGVDIYIIKK